MTEVFVVGDKIRVDQIACDHHGVRILPAEQGGDLVLDEVSATGVAQQHQLDRPTGFQSLERGGLRIPGAALSYAADSVVVRLARLEAGQLQGVIRFWRVILHLQPQLRCRPVLDH